MDHQRAAVQPIPSYELYGEAEAWPTPELIHVESIAARSRLHNWEIRPHRHAGLFQLLWLRRGEARCLLDDEQQALAAGSVVLVPRQSVHGFRFSDEAEGLVITLAYPLLIRADGAFSQQLLEMVAPRICDAASLRRQPQIAPLLQSLGEEFEARRDHRGLILDSLALALLASLMRIVADTSSGHDAAPRVTTHLARFLAEVERRFREHLPLDHYARHIGISAAHLNALCRAQAGRSALEMIHARLALEARRDLVYTAMTIREVSEELGFVDPAYFTRFFRRVAGVSPREFRQRAGAPATE
jgi:AraC family transcriptional activator of pobA